MGQRSAIAMFLLSGGAVLPVAVMASVPEARAFRVGVSHAATRRSAYARWASQGSDHSLIAAPRGAPRTDRMTDWWSCARAMSRRTFSCFLASLLVAMPSWAHAQRATTPRRIGRLESGAPDATDEISEALRAFGWIEGQNLHVERRYANNQPEKLQALADDLVRAKVEVIITGGTPATLAAKRATSTVPIVFRAAGDPVGFGLVSSLARPGGNVTGFSLSGPDVATKYLSLAKELLPQLRRIGVLETSTNAYFRAVRRHYEQTCQLLNLEPVFTEIATANEIDNAVAELARQHSQALVLRADSLIFDNRFAIVAAAMQRDLPTIAEPPAMVRDGGALMSYAPTDAEEARRAARYVDRILRGARPADLPVEQSTTFELVINLKTARALRLPLPQSLLTRADELIQ
jgi:putative tryptophan/tyrosine transport system substrate-binding protein